MDFRQRWQRFSQGYQRFVEKQGFPIIMTVCVAVIVFSAVWSGRMETALPAPTPPVDQAQSAAQLQQQSLTDVTTPTPSPTPAPVIWRAPLDRISVLRSFDASRLQQSAVTGVWRLHDAVDLAAETGGLVYAMADGVVLACGEEGVQGAWVSLDHGGGVKATYAGMSLLAAIRAGDPVKAGQTIGFAGNGMVDETDLQPHLHLRVTRDGQAIDPLLLFVPKKSSEGVAFYPDMDIIRYDTFYSGGISHVRHCRVYRS
ncbi:MAG: peptidoglycan DD-metalloendopeptidase family protein [Aristaeellaceae bacterium]